MAQVLRLLLVMILVSCMAQRNVPQTLTDETLAQIVEEEEREESWIIFFTQKRPFCRHCEGMISHYYELARDEELQQQQQQQEGEHHNNNNIYVGIINAPDNLHSVFRFAIRGYPSIIYLPKDDPQHYYLYRGIGDASHMKQWILTDYHQSTTQNNNNNDNNNKETTATSSIKIPIPPPSNIILQSMIDAHLSWNLFSKLLHQKTALGPQVTYALFGSISAIVLLILILSIFACTEQSPQDNDDNNNIPRNHLQRNNNTTFWNSQQQQQQKRNGYQKVKTG